MTTRLAILVVAAALAFPPAAFAQRPVLDYQERGRFAYFAYSPPPAGELALVMKCAKGLGKIQANVLQGPMQNGAVTFTSGGKTLIAPGTKAADGKSVEITANATDPALSAFRDSGNLDVTGAGFHISIRTRDVDRGPIGQFFVMCEEGDNL